MRQRPRIDGNQRQIVRELREADFSVTIMSALGNGCPDILVGKWGISLPVEIKVPGEEMTDAEERWFMEWKGSAIISENSETIMLTMLEMKNKTLEGTTKCQHTKP